MIGLGVGIDYALFILTRFREAYRTPGPTFETPASRSSRRSTRPGRAVLFAGSTVVIALLGMMLLGVSFLYGVAISASIGVLLVMLASLTLLPGAADDRRARRVARAASQARAGARAAQAGSDAPRRADAPTGCRRRRRDGCAGRLRAAPPEGDRRGLGGR